MSIGNGCASVVVLLTLALAGCASERAVYHNFSRIVDVSDGISAQEAKIMAQKQLISTVQKRDYRVTAPDIQVSLATRQYPDFWFVVFGHNWFSPISTDSLAKTYTELKEAVFLVVIHKKSGVIKYSGEWYAKRENGFNWIFDPQGYKKAHPLALPPGE